MSDDELLPTKPDRGAPLVATFTRGLAVVLSLALVFTAAAYAYVAYAHPDRSLQSVATWAGVAWLGTALAAIGLLRAEESRLQRELRTARTGTAIIRDMVLRRRQRLPLAMRLVTSTLGTAALLLVEGDRSAALDALAASSPLMRTGRLRRLRDVIEADAERASGSAAGVSRCIEALLAAPRIGNREADRYRTHVLVKAILQKGDGEHARPLMTELAEAADEEERPYAVWLRVWFDLEDEAGKPLEDGALRVAALLARTHGAEDLVKKLDARLAALAGEEPIADGSAPE
jgi:hypothetical protein